MEGEMVDLEENLKKIMHKEEDSQHRGRDKDKEGLGDLVEEEEVILEIEKEEVAMEVEGEVDLAIQEVGEEGLVIQEEEGEVGLEEAEVVVLGEIGEDLEETEMEDLGDEEEEEVGEAEVLEVEEAEEEEDMEDMVVVKVEDSLMMEDLAVEILVIQETMHVLEEETIMTKMETLEMFETLNPKNRNLKTSLKHNPK